MIYKAEIKMITKEELTCCNCGFWLRSPIQNEWGSSCILTGEDIQAYIYEQRGSISDACPFKLIGDNKNDAT